MKQKRKYNISSIIYGVISIATLMLATIGTTFSYFTTIANTANNTKKDKMETINFDLTIAKVTNADEKKGGLIPISNNMIEKAVSNSNGNGICIDDTGNAICQIYKITVINKGAESIFVDGYVTLSGGVGTPIDYIATTNKTPMRWAQVFCNKEVSNLVTTSCTTAGISTVRPDVGNIELTALGGAETMSDGLNVTEIKTVRNDVVLPQATGAIIKGNKYEIINRNYIRVSDHNIDNYNYTRSADTTSALVYSQYLEANDNNITNNTGTSNSIYTDAQVYYIAVWLSENGLSKTDEAVKQVSSKNNFFRGNAIFVSAQGHNVVTTLAGNTRVNSGI